MVIFWSLTAEEKAKVIALKKKMSEKQSLRVQMTEAILTKNVDYLTLDIFDAMNTKYGDRFFDEDVWDEDDDGSDDECMVCDEF